MLRNPVLVLAVNRLPGHNGYPKLRLLEESRDESDLRHGFASFFAGRRKIDFDRLLREAEQEYRKLRHWKIDYRVLGSAEYPRNLGAICDPPLILYFRGSMPSPDKAPVALVGTRRPSAEAKREAYKISLEFALAGYTVVSGMAFGIDRSAHEGALDSRGSTWAVLAGGLDRPSPISHRRLASRILDGGGALIGEIPPGQFPQKYAFPRRNRILSGLCRGCVVVQAPKKSGALITADFALDQGRDLYVASSGMLGSYSDGTRLLESQGAPVITGAADVMADWGRFLDIRAVEKLSAPTGPDDLVRFMKIELNGRMYRHTGGWFEYRGA